MVNAPRRFYLHRVKDVSGVSGTGTVATGVAFPDDGKVVLRWCSERSDIHQVSIFNSIDDVARIHGHDGATKVVWIDLAVDVIRPNPSDGRSVYGAFRRKRHRLTVIR